MKQKQNVTENNKTEGYGMTKDQMIELMEKINKGRKDNLESRRSALNTLVGVFPVGGKVFVDPLKINFRDDGNFYVWDAHHRLEAASLCGTKYLLYPAA